MCVCIRFWLWRCQNEPLNGNALQWLKVLLRRRARRFFRILLIADAVTGEPDEFNDDASKFNTISTQRLLNLVHLFLLFSLFFVIMLLITLHLYIPSSFIIIFWNNFSYFFETHVTVLRVKVHNSSICSQYLMIPVIKNKN